MEKQIITLSERDLRNFVKANLMEAVQNGTLDEGHLGNFFSSLGKGLQGTIRGGLDQGRQMYNQTMADKSASDAEVAANKANDLQTQLNGNNTYAKIPECKKIAAEYDEKIRATAAELGRLRKEKTTKLQAAKAKYQQGLRNQMNKANGQASKFGEKANNAQGKATDYMNRRRQSLGLDANDNTRMVAEAMDEQKLEESIRHSIRKYLH